MLKNLCLRILIKTMTKTKITHRILELNQSQWLNHMSNSTHKEK